MVCLDRFLHSHSYRWSCPSNGMRMSPCTEFGVRNNTHFISWRPYAGLLICLRYSCISSSL